MLASAFSDDPSTLLTKEVDGTTMAFRPHARAKHTVREVLPVPLGP
jgi:hypothetical protein